MPASLAHFAINANDVDRARRFYEKVFGWTFEAWGPPGFLLIHAGTATRPLGGALQQRRELLPGKAMVGFECTFAVPNVDQTAEAVRAAGGRIVMEKTTISGVCDLIFFEDPEGNVLGAATYDPGVE